MCFKIGVTSYYLYFIQWEALERTSESANSEPTKQTSASEFTEEREGEFKNPRHNKIHIPLPSEDHNDLNDQAPAPASSPSPPVQLGKKVQATTNKRIFESSEDESDDDDQAAAGLSQPRKKVRAAASPPVQPRKKLQKGSKKKNQRSSTVEEVDKRSKDPKNNTKKPSTGQSKKTKNGASDDSDSDVELIEKQKETPEKELGMRIN